MSTITMTAHYAKLKAGVAVLFLVAIVFYLAYLHIYSSRSPSAAYIPEGVDRLTSGRGMLSEMALEEIPENKLPEADMSTVQHKTSELAGNEIHIDGATGDIYYREAIDQSYIEKEPEGDVLLLHGANFDASTWHQLHTIDQLAKLGYRVVAIDLPGYGKSREVTYSGEAETLMLDVMKELNINRPVVVSPSMSGEYALPLVLHHPYLIRAFVAVAPVGTEAFSDSEYENCQVPTLIVYGDQDTGIGLESLSHLQHLPHHIVEKLVDARHPAYLDQPERWHQILYNFLNAVPK